MMKAFLDTPFTSHSSSINLVRLSLSLNVNLTLSSNIILLTPPFILIISYHLFDVNRVFDISLKKFYNGVITTLKGVCNMSNSNDRYTRDNETRFTLRIDTELLEKVKMQAINNKRSTAKEIEFILEKYFQNSPKE